MPQSSQRFSPPAHPDAAARVPAGRFEFLPSLSLRRWQSGLSVALLLAAAAIAITGGGTVAAAPVLAVLLLLRLQRDVNPAGWVFEVDPGRGCCCRRLPGEPGVCGQLQSRGEFAGLLWLELRAQTDHPDGGARGTAAGGGLAASVRLAAGAVSKPRLRRPRLWLICRDALSEEDWRLLRRELRLSTGAARSRPR